MSTTILSGGDIRCPIEHNTLGQYLFNQAAKHSKNICQINANLEISETYASVNTRSVRLAISLCKKGLSVNDVVLICSSNTLDSAIPLIATLYLAAKPIFLDPSFTPRSAKHLISVVTPKIIFVEESAVNLIEEALANTEIHPEIIVLGNSNKYQTFCALTVPDVQENIFKPSQADVTDDALMFFSSGTSGLPKAISHSHNNFLRGIFSFNVAMMSCTNLNSIFNFSSFYWISGIYLFFLSFLHGAARIFSEDVAGETMLNIIEKYKISFALVSSLYTYKLTSVKNLGRFNLSSITAFLAAGTSLSLEQYKRLEVLFKSCNIFHLYGLTELGVLALYNSKIVKSVNTTKSTPSGRIIFGNMAKVVDPDTELALGPNQEGEIRFKSKYLMLGYYKLDSDCFDNDGFFKTGDLGYFDNEDCLFVVGRIKEMFKYLNWHIVPSSIEAVLLDHPAVAEAVIFGIPRGGEGEVPAACVVLKEAVTSGSEEIANFVAEQVADREKLRGGVYFVDFLPKTPSGKIIRKEVRAKMLKSLSIYE